MDHLIELAEAQRRLRSVGPVSVTQWVPLPQSHGRILAMPVRAQIDMPPYDRAMMDGYAVRAANTSGATAQFPVQLELCPGKGLAGQAPATCLGSGQAARVMTGAPLPSGSDAVLRREWVVCAQESAAHIHALRSVRAEEAVQRRGAGMRAGDLLLSPGTLLTPSEIAALATQGYERVPVMRPPRVAVITTGTELVPPGDSRAAYGLWDANSALLVELVRSWGGAVDFIRRTDDSMADIADAVRQALSRSDIVVTAGGVSVGDADTTVVALESIGVRRLFWGVRMRPGTPAYAGEANGIPVLAVSGNPRAALVNAAVFLLPAILRSLGAECRMRRHIGACRLYGVQHKPLAKLVRFLSGTLRRQEGTLALFVESDQSPGLIQAGTDAFGVVTAGCKPVDGDGTGALFLQPQPLACETDPLDETVAELMGLAP